MLSTTLVLLSTDPSKPERYLFAGHSLFMKRPGKNRNTATAAWNLTDKGYGLSINQQLRGTRISHHEDLRSKPYMASPPLETTHPRFTATPSTSTTAPQQPSSQHEPSSPYSSSSPPPLTESPSPPNSPATSLSHRALAPWHNHTSVGS